MVVKIIFMYFLNIMSDQTFKEIMGRIAVITVDAKYNQQLKGEYENLIVDLLKQIKECESSKTGQSNAMTAAALASKVAIEQAAFESVTRENAAARSILDAKSEMDQKQAGVVAEAVRQAKAEEAARLKEEYDFAAAALNVEVQVKIAALEAALVDKTESEERIKSELEASSAANTRTSADLQEKLIEIAGKEASFAEMMAALKAEQADASISSKTEIDAKIANIQAENERLIADKGTLERDKQELENELPDKIEAAVSAEREKLEAEQAALLERQKTEIEATEKKKLEDELKAIGIQLEINEQRWSSEEIKKKIGEMKFNLREATENLSKSTESIEFEKSKLEQLTAQQLQERRRNMDGESRARAKEAMITEIKMKNVELFKVALIELLQQKLAATQDTETKTKIQGIISKLLQYKQDAASKSQLELLKASTAALTGENTSLASRLAALEAAKLAVETAKGSTEEQITKLTDQIEQISKKIKEIPMTNVELQEAPLEGIPLDGGGIKVKVTEDFKVTNESGAELPPKFDLQSELMNIVRVKAPDQINFMERIINQYFDTPGAIANRLDRLANRSQPAESHDGFAPIATGTPQSLGFTEPAVSSPAVPSGTGIGGQKKRSRRLRRPYKNTKRR
jgi:hypothetical protein